MDSNSELVNYLQDIGVLRTPAIIDAFRAIDRADFVPEAFREDAYNDYPIAIASGQTISQPYTVAFMLELLEPRPGQNILDVGSGSGWTTALLAHIVGARGSIVGVEILPKLLEFGGSNLQKYKFKNARIEPAGDALGWQQNAPYDRILVSAAGTKVPSELIDQVAPSGIMVIPVNDSIIKVYEKSGRFYADTFQGFAFVPLIT